MVFRMFHPQAKQPAKILTLGWSSCCCSFLELWDGKAERFLILISWSWENFWWGKLTIPKREKHPQQWDDLVIWWTPPFRVGITPFSTPSNRPFPVVRLPRRLEHMNDEAVRQRLLRMDLMSMTARDYLRGWMDGSKNVEHEEILLFFKGIIQSGGFGNWLLEEKLWMLWMWPGSEPPVHFDGFPSPFLSMAAPLCGFF